ncbi:YciI family protein, partial [Nitrospira sp. BLG_2]|uniref:YciI family protein n=1 Tax=Nitrospira sp. BLG_2 TaxID=3397507 RepID=UPI003B9A0024
MSTSTPQADFLLLFRGTDWERRLSPEQFEQFVSDWSQWFERLKQEGKCTGGHPLHLEGKLVSGKNGRMVTDGPFTESKEAIGGYFYLRV